MLLSEIYDNILACMDIITWMMYYLDFYEFFLKWFVIVKNGEIVDFLALDLTLINFNQLID